MLFFDMKEWVLNIAFTVFFISIITLIIPNGKINKHIKKVLSLILAVIVLQPILSIKNGDINFENFLYNESFGLQDEYLEYIVDAKINSNKDKCSVLLKEMGVEGAFIEFENYIDESFDIVAKKIIIDLKKAVINLDKQHIDIIGEIKKVVSNYFNVNLDCVVVYE